MDISDLHAKEERCNYLLQDNRIKLNECFQFVENHNYQLLNSSRSHVETNLREIESLLQFLNRGSRGLTKRERTLIKEFVSEGKSEIKSMKIKLDKINN